MMCDCVSPPCSVHLRVSEKLNLVAGRDGGVQSMEILGIIMLRISDSDYGKIRVSLENKETRPIQFQVRREGGREGRKEIRTEVKV